jgi:hypothetical protein
MTTVVFVIAAFLASALLFAVQPLVVRMLLPSLGGSPAVWNAGMVFFQSLLLAGYLYAHWSLKWFRAPVHRWLYLLVLLVPLAVLPIALPVGWVPPAESDPTAWALWVLLVMVGAPYFALATVSPTLQTWFATLNPRAPGEAYRLYAAGNIGSVLALLSYPFLVEPALGIRAQAVVWTVGYGLLLVLLLFCAFRVPVSSPAGSARRISTARGSERFRWIVYAAIPVMMMLGVTRHVADEIASFPLLWIVPLALYLLTFIVAFGGRGASLEPLMGRLARLLIIPALLSMFRVPVPLWLVIVVHLALFFALAMILHQKLYASRPRTEELTDFYVYLSVGGALGGVFVVIVAPMVFNAIYEYPLAIALGLLLLPRDPVSPGLIARLRDNATLRNAALLMVLLMAAGAAWEVSRSDLIDSTAVGARVLAGLAGLVAYLMLDRPRQFALAMTALLVVGTVVRPAGTVLQDRSFFGVLRVQETGAKITMVHGTTVHGSQDRARPGLPQGYYHTDGPAGSTIAHLAALNASYSVGIVGLGVGALAAVLDEGDELTFYEIDPNVVRVANDPILFTYLADSASAIATVIGDGRLSLEQVEEGHDLLVVDAFSGDAIPVHLLTREAFELYARVTKGGPVLVHISNRHLDLSFVVAATAKAAGLESWIWEYGPSAQARETGATASRWMLLGLPGMALPPGNWWPLDSTVPAWTDDYSDIVSTISEQ